MRPVIWGVSSIVVLTLATACVEDVVLPDVAVESSSAICGNGVVESGETCDVPSPGCLSCKVVAGWVCDARGCSPPACDAGASADGGDPCADAERVDACDMSGYWAARETNAARDTVVGSLQTSSNWFLFRFAQQGETYEVVESLDCGVHVTGTVTVDSTAGTLRSSLHANRMDGGGGRPARRGTSKLAGNGCAVSLDRFYKVRGVTDDFLPTDPNAKPTLASLPPLPKTNDPVKDTTSPAGTVDPDGDGQPGTSFRITGFVSGIRNSAQRDWKEFASSADAPVPLGAHSFTIPGSFDLEESVLRLTECGSACGLMAAAARAATDIPSRLAFSFLGRTPDAAGVAAVVVGAPRTDVERDLKTCENVRLLLPHVGEAE